jgi:hypothetical protein
VELKLAHEHRAYITYEPRVFIFPPSSTKTIVLYTSEENDQECHTQSSKRYVDKFRLLISEGTQLELW